MWSSFNPSASARIEPQSLPEQQLAPAPLVANQSTGLWGMLSDAGAASLEGIGRFVGGNLASKILKFAFIPGDGSTIEQLSQRQITLEQMRNQTLQRLDWSAKTVPLITRDEILLDAVWLKHSSKAPTVVLFHGNACTLDSMKDMAAWYSQRGSNVLMVTMRGYPGSGGSFADSGEMGYYYDVEAVYKFLCDQKIDKDRIHAHGFSFGGSLAAAMGYFFHVPVTLDHTFTSIEGAAVGFVNAQLTTDLIKGAVRSIFPIDTTGKKAVESTVPGARPFVADGLNTLQKIAQTTRPVFIAYGKKDYMISPDFAHQMYQARYPLPVNATAEELQAYHLQKDAHVIALSGGHTSINGYMPPGAVLMELDSTEQARCLKYFGAATLEEYQQLYEERGEKLRIFEAFLVNNNLLGPPQTAAALTNQVASTISSSLQNPSHTVRYQAPSAVVAETNGSFFSSALTRPTLSPQAVRDKLQALGLFTNSTQAEVKERLEAAAKQVSHISTFILRPSSHGSNFLTLSMMNNKQDVSEHHKIFHHRWDLTKEPLTDVSGDAILSIIKKVCDRNNIDCGKNAWQPLVEVEKKFEAVKLKIQALGFFTEASQKEIEDRLETAAKRAPGAFPFILRPSSQGPDFLTLSTRLQNADGDYKWKHSRLNLTKIQVSDVSLNNMYNIIKVLNNNENLSFNEEVCQPLLEIEQKFST